MTGPARASTTTTSPDRRSARGRPIRFARDPRDRPARQPDVGQGRGRAAGRAGALSGCARAVRPSTWWSGATPTRRSDKLRDRVAVGARCRGRAGRRRDGPPGAAGRRRHRRTRSASSRRAPATTSPARSGCPCSDPVAAVDHRGRAATARQVDVGAGGRPVVRRACWASGFDSVVNERANRMSWPQGPARYNLAIARRAADLPAGAVRAGPRRRDRGRPRRCSSRSATAPSYGGGMRVCPDASLDDGLLDVTVLGPISKPEFLRVFPTVYKGTHVRHPAVDGHSGPGSCRSTAPASSPTPTVSGSPRCRSPARRSPGRLHVLAPPSSRRLEAMATPAERYAAARARQAELPS